VIARYLLPVLALLGIAGTLAAILADDRTPAIAGPAVTPAGSPYSSYIAGTGIVEADTGNITIGSPVAGVVAELYVEVGDFVEAGRPLFKIDDREPKAQLVTARAQADAAAAELQRAQHQLSYSEELTQRDSSAVSAQALTDLRDQVAIAAANSKLAEAEIARLDMDIERYTVRAPVSGRVLQLDMRVGETIGGSETLLLFGDDRRLAVRVSIDESEAGRFEPGAAATAFVRGNSALLIPLVFRYVEPHVVPKTSLTGRSTERTDTRVLQVLYGFDSEPFPVYVGQQLDVFIEAAPVASDEFGDQN
jgi:HlyD family secretion protein